VWLFKAFDGEAFEREGKDFRLVNELDGEEVGCGVQSFLLDDLGVQAGQD
jgi:hypothetical protein